MSFMTTPLYSSKPIPFYDYRLKKEK